MIRKLVSLHQSPLDPLKWYISYGYYELVNGRLEYAGVYEDCTITDDELYALLKPKLIKREEVNRGRTA